ncbi:hypothetical protein E2320_005637 [Naja naja]|nr:hypothetical protein E2320_005637 [Naja naja]
MACKPCLDGFFSSTSDLEFCLLHTSCEAKKRVHVHVGTMTADTLCSICLPGYYSPDGETDVRSSCLPCLSAPQGVPECQGSGKRPARLTRNAEAHPRHSEKLAPNGTRDGKPDESATQYAVLAIVPVFCIMGLLGILFCNLLMKKGKRSCPGRDAEGIPQQATHTADLQACEQGLAMRSGPSCTRCSQKKWPEVLRATEAVSTSVLPGSYAPKPPRPGEITILSVGRFRVARIPEQRPNPAELKTISEGVGEAEPSEPPYASLAPEQKLLVSNGGRLKRPSGSEGQQEVVI